MPSSKTVNSIIRDAQARISGLLVVCRDVERKSGQNFPTLCAELFEIQQELERASDLALARDGDVADLVNQASRIVEEIDRDARHNHSVVVEAILQISRVADSSLAKLVKPDDDRIEVMPAAPVPLPPNVVPLFPAAEGGAA